MNEDRIDAETRIVNSIATRLRDTTPQLRRINAQQATSDQILRLRLSAQRALLWAQKVNEEVTKIEENSKS